MVGGGGRGREVIKNIIFSINPPSIEDLVKILIKKSRINRKNRKNC